MRSLERVNIRTNVRTYVHTYVLTYIRTGQTIYPLHNFVARGDNNVRLKSDPMRIVQEHSTLLQRRAGRSRVILLCYLRA